MGDRDHAILVAISRYRDHNHYPDLDGPMNDYRAFLRWLLDKKGGDVPRRNIHLLVTKRQFAKLTTSRASIPLNLPWEPSKNGFKSKLEKVIQDPATGEYVKHPEARLYMHFAGHGFSSDWEALQSASLVPADVWGSQMDDIPGTVYMEGIRKMALFSEIVLIMDCCRTLMRTGTYSQSVFRPFSAKEQDRVRVLSAYAVPKDGAAQERILDGCDKPVGLLTHAFLRAMKEIPPDIQGRVPDNAIDQFLAIQWPRWFSDKSAPPSPRIYPPPAALPRIFFNARRDFVEQTFSVPAASDGLEFQLDSAHLPAIHALVEGDNVQWERAMDSASLITMPFSPLEPDGRRSFTLKLLPEKYRIDFGIDAKRLPLIFQPSANRVDL